MMMPEESVLFLDLDVVRDHAAHRIVGTTAARVRCEMPEDRPAHFAPRRQAEARVCVVECRFDAGALSVEQIAREMFAAGGAHRIGLEERTLYLRIAVFAEAIPRIWRRFLLFVQQVLKKLIDCVLHGITTSPAVVL
jgi:hypothetical protein